MTKKEILKNRVKELAIKLNNAFNSGNFEEVSNLMGIIIKEKLNNKVTYYRNNILNK